MMARALCLLIGYLFGSLQTGYIMSRLRGFDIRSYGSHSTGATNSLRVMGTGAGAAVLLGDALKALIPCFAVRLLYGGRADIQMLMLLWAACGVILGHDYPFYLGFRGGKGVASTVGVLLALDVRLALLWCGLFLVVVLISRFVSLASMLSMLLLIVLCIGGRLQGALPTADHCASEFMALGIFLPSLSIWRHRSNIGRLCKGTESRLNLRSQGMHVGKK